MENMSLQSHCTRKKLSTSGHFKGSHSWILSPGYVRLLCFVIIQRQIIQNGFHSNHEGCRTNLFLTLSQANYFTCLTDAVLTFETLQRKISFEGYINVFDCEVKVWISIQYLPKHTP